MSNKDNIIVLREANTIAEIMDWGVTITQAEPFREGQQKYVTISNEELIKIVDALKIDKNEKK